MFYQIRYQTGEIVDIVNEMIKGNIPCMDVVDMKEFDWVVEKLSTHGVYRVESIPLDKDARDRIKEPEFEFRASFASQKDPSNSDNLMFIDFYFEPVIDDDYDSIYGD